MASTARRPPAAAAPAMAGADFDSDKMDEEMVTKSVVDVRDFFPETWLFDLELTE